MKKHLSELIDQYKKIDKSELISFSLCIKPLDMALYVLYIFKTKLNLRKLDVDLIVSIILDVEETSTSASSITNALKRASNKVHRYHENGRIYYEIMKPGKEYLLSLQKNELINVFYFEPETRYSSKSLMKNQIFSGLTGDVKIVDPYCNERTLDMLTPLKNLPIKVLTQLKYLKDLDRQQFIRNIADFKAENKNVDFRDYQNSDIHDRYIVSDEKLILVGHSLKDLGSKESFAIILGRENYIDMYNALNENFNRRWKVSATI